MTKKLLFGFILFCLFFPGFTQEKEKIEQKYVVKKNINGETSETKIETDDSVTVIRKYKNGELVEERTLNQHEAQSYLDDIRNKQGTSETIMEDLNIDVELLKQNIYNGIQDIYFEISDSFLDVSIDMLDSVLHTNEIIIKHELEDVLKNVDDHRNKIIIMKSDDNDLLEKIIIDSDTFMNMNFDMDIETIFENTEDLDLDINNNNFELRKIVIIAKVVKIEDIEKQDVKKLKLDALQIYPNPNNGRFTVTYNNDRKKPVTIAIYNIQGQSVYQVESIGEGNVTIDVDLSGMEKGTYIMRISQGKKEISKKMIIE